jgi:hypothetical protein
MSTIFISIASYLDSELEQTVTDLLSKATHPERLHLSVNSQDRPDSHPDLETLCAKYATALTYVKADFRSSRGTCLARHVCQLPLNDSFTYYMQIDSHTLFLQDWDSILIDDYERCKSKWGSYIFSTYPLSYYYVDNQVKFETKTDDIPNCLAIIPSKHFSRYTAHYKAYKGDEYGELTDYFTGGFSFGDTAHFLKVPYDKRIYHSGEEPTMSIRFFAEGISIICPPKNYVWHHYAGGDCKRRRNHWDGEEDWDKDDHAKAMSEINALTEETLNKFYNHELEYPYGLKDPAKLEEWALKVTVEEDDLYV